MPIPSKGDVAARFAHDEFRAAVLSQAFACVAGAATVRAGNYRYFAYGELGGQDSIKELADDLRGFIADFPLEPERFASCVASFREPAGMTPHEFEHRLWSTLQGLHELDTEPWDPDVSSDPGDAKFSFSFHGRSFFVVGMHPGSERWTRRVTWPTLVFNAHSQFEELRRTGRFEAMQRTIRRRDTRLQGSANPSLENYGAQSEARQYSGRLVDPDWQCPFHKKE